MFVFAILLYLAIFIAFPLPSTTRSHHHNSSTYYSHESSPAGRRPRSNSDSIAASAVLPPPPSTAALDAIVEVEDVAHAPHAVPCVVLPATVKAEPQSLVSPPSSPVETDIVVPLAAVTDASPRVNAIAGRPGAGGAKHRRNRAVDLRILTQSVAATPSTHPVLCNALEPSSLPTTPVSALLSEMPRLISPSAFLARGVAAALAPVPLPTTVIASSSAAASEKRSPRMTVSPGSASSGTASMLARVAARNNQRARMFEEGRMLLGVPGPLTPGLMTAEM